MSTQCKKMMTTTRWTSPINSFVYDLPKLSNSRGLDENSVKRVDICWIELSFMNIYFVNRYPVLTKNESHEGHRIARWKERKHRERAAWSFRELRWKLLASLARTRSLPFPVPFRSARPRITPSPVFSQTGPRARFEFLSWFIGARRRLIGYSYLFLLVECFPRFQVVVSRNIKTGTRSLFPARVATRVARETRAIGTSFTHTADNRRQ